ncbi:MAG TPA: hypothetical protein VE487_16965 [Ilumatobacter sp.]|nr:hypothetical protein [Ilumatobacter sp.]
MAIPTRAPPGRGWEGHFFLPMPNRSDWSLFMNPQAVELRAVGADREPRIVMKRIVMKSRKRWVHQCRTSADNRDPTRWAI